MGLTLVVLLVHDIPFTNYLRTVESDRIITALERDSFVMAGRAEESLEDPSSTTVAGLQKTLDNYKTQSGARVIVTDAKSVVIADTDEAAKIGTSYANRPEIQAALKGQITNGRRDPGPNSDELMYVAVPVLNGNDVLGVVRITFPSAVVEQAVWQRVRGIAIVAGITLLLAAIVAFLMATSISRRLRELEETTDEFTKGDLDIRASTSEGAPEIRSLASSFNSMADQLTRLMAQQRAFAGDASHQLRTPLTALQLRLERALEMVESDPAGASERIEAAMLEAERLQRLVEGLLVLSRTEANTRPETATFNLAEMARERAESWEALASEANVRVSCTAPSLVMVHAVPGAIEQVIDNYIDNALAIVSSGTKIEVVITQDSQFATVHVLDEGPGMPELDLDKAFNRFWRARSDAHGSGLGLAIVERLTTLSGGQVRLANRLPHGLDAQADFPLA
jgi:signal transduction histidine kinase